MMDAYLVEILTARDAADLIAPRLEQCLHERLVVLHLDDRRRLVHRTEIEGCGVEVSLPIRLIIAAALACDARGLVLGHNHPSGDPAPSEADRLATLRLAEAAAPLGIVIHDHLIFAGSDCRSFRALGLL
jgi:DNA repair protein RadC